MHGMVLRPMMGGSGIQLKGIKIDELRCEKTLLFPWKIALRNGLLGGR